MFLLLSVAIPQAKHLIVVVVVKAEISDNITNTIT